ncbi:MAG: hypothetical protein ACI81R_002929 [Bradymonadia bacterium]|jgi:hypothetical protein
MHNRSAATPTDALHTLHHLQADTTDLAAASFTRAGVAIADRVHRSRPERYEHLSLDEQRVVDTVLWSSAASGLCFILVSVFFALGGVWVGALLGLLGLGLQLVTRRLVNQSRITLASISLLLWATLLIDGFLLLTGGHRSTALQWYAIIPGVAIVVIPRRWRIRTILFIALHQIAIVVLISAGFYSDLLAPAGAFKSAHLDYIASTVFAGCFGFGAALAQREMVERLRKAERKARLAMRYVVTGFLVLDRRGRLAVDSSAGGDEWLLGAQSGVRFVDLLQKSQPAFSDKFSVTFDALVEGTLPMALSLSQLPPLITLSGQVHGVTYRAISTDDSTDWNRLIITFEDRSDAIAKEAAAAERQTLGALIRSLQRDPHATQCWVQECRQRRTALSRDLEAEDWADHLVAFHEIAEREELSALLCAVERAVEAAAGGARGRAAELMFAACTPLLAQYDELMEEDRFSGVRVSGEEYSQILRLIEQRAPHEVLLHRAHEWSPESTAAAIRTGEISVAGSQSPNTDAA